MFILIAAALAMQGAPTVAPPPALACPAGSEAPRGAPAVAAGRNAAHAPVLKLGATVRTTLAPVGEVAFAVPPAKPAAAADRGGLFAFAVPAAGRYRVSLGAGVWADVVRGRAVVASVAHGHGPACSPARKQVDFDLRPGRHLLQLSGDHAAALGVAVARVKAVPSGRTVR